MRNDEHQEEISEAEPEERIAISSRVMSQIRYEGPLPPSLMLKEYEDVPPGVADRILRMAEQQASHRQRIEKAVISSKSKAEMLGVVFAGLIGLSTIIVALSTSTSDVAPRESPHIASLVSLVGAYLYGAHSERAEREEKQKRHDEN